MLYCSYDQYAAAGGSMTEQSFTVLCARASRLIDGLTFGRAEARLLLHRPRLPHCCKPPLAQTLTVCCIGGASDADHHHRGKPDP